MQQTFLLGSGTIQRDYYVFAKIINPLNEPVVVFCNNDKITVPSTGEIFHKKKILVSFKPKNVLFQAKGNFQRHLYLNGENTIEIKPTTSMMMKEMLISRYPGIFDHFMYYFIILFVNFINSSAILLTWCHCFTCFAETLLSEKEIKNVILRRIYSECCNNVSNELFLFS